MRRSAVAVSVILAILPSAAIAEVMDKEPSLGEVWRLAIVASLVAFVCCPGCPPMGGGVESPSGGAGVR